MDLSNIDALCDSRGLRFQHRIIYPSDKTIQIVGETPCKGGEQILLHDRQSLQMEMGHASKPQKKVSELENDEQQALAKIEENIKQLQDKLKNENALAWQANK